MSNKPSPDLPGDRHKMLNDAAEDVLVPLARLLVSQGLPFAQAEELFKRAYVRAARDARRAAGVASARDVSQVTMATGINRREVARISAELQPRAAQRPSPATQVFFRWIGDKRLRDRKGQPRPLPRTGPAPSFETLAAEVTRHVHPRSLLDELCRLGLAELVEEGQTVRLLQDRFVPQDDEKRLYGFLGANVGDHLAAAAENVMHRERRHFEQAIFADDLSQQSAQSLTTLARAQWSQLAAAVVPEIEKLIAQDRAHGRPATHRARLGLFSFQEPQSEDHHETNTAQDSQG
jgi:hypothetical protein